MATAPVKAIPVQASMLARGKSTAKAAGEASSAKRGIAPGAGYGSATGLTPDSSSGAEFGKLFREQAGVIPFRLGKSPIEEASQTDGSGAPAGVSGARAKAPGTAESEIAESGVAASGVADQAHEVASAALPGSPKLLLLKQLNELQGRAAGQAATTTPHSGAAEASDPGSVQGNGKVAGRTESKGGSSLHPDKKAERENATAGQAAPATPLLIAIPPAPLAAPHSPQPAIVVTSGKGKAAPTASSQTLADGKDGPVSRTASQEISAELAPHGTAQGGGANQVQLPASLTAPLVSASQAAADGGKAVTAALSADSAAPASGASSSAPVGHAGHSAAELKPAASTAVITPPQPEASASMAPHAQPPQVASAATAVGAASGASGPSGTSATGATALYDRIDQAGAPMVLHSGAQHISVGVHDPNLGWVEIQTQNTAGHVDATLVTSSGQTHDSLAAQLPAIAQFLQQRDLRVGTLAVQQQPPSSGGGMGSGTGYAGDGGAGAHHSGRERDAPRSTPRTTGFPTGPGRITGRVSGAASGGEASPYHPLSYINVRA